MSSSPVLTDVRRASNGRPYIWLQDHSREVLYSRTSTFARALDDGAALSAWKTRMALKGAAMDPALLHGVDWARPGLADQRAEEMRELADANIGANFGNAVHSLVNLQHQGEDIAQYEPEQPLLDAVAAFNTLMRGLETVDSERFTVTDHFKVAGTYDRLLRLPDGRVVVGDLKTGTIHLTQCAIQIAMYASGMHYDPETGKRQPIHQDLDPTLGVIISVPKDTTLQPRLVWIDLREGYRLAVLADEVRKARSAKVAVESPLTSGGAPMREATNV